MQESIRNKITLELLSRSELITCYNLHNLLKLTQTVNFIPETHTVKQSKQVLSYLCCVLDDQTELNE